MAGLLDIDSPTDVIAAAQGFRSAVTDPADSAYATARSCGKPSGQGEPSALDVALTGKTEWMTGAISGAAQDYSAKAELTYVEAVCGVLPLGDTDTANGATIGAVEV